MISRLLSCLYLLDTLITPVYALLTLIALSSLAIPFLQDLASRGKTRDTAPASASIQQQHEYRSSAAFFPSLVRRVSHGEEFLIQKKFFLHFYVCGLLSFAVFYLLGASFAAPTMDRTPSLSHSTTLVLLGIHLSRRLYECLHVHRWTPQSKVHLAGYLLGILHYILLPIVFTSVPVPYSHRKEVTVSRYMFRKQKRNLTIDNHRGLIILPLGSVSTISATLPAGEASLAHHHQQQHVQC
jgi:hypothetical protein